MTEIQIRIATIDDSAIIAHHRNSMFAEMGAGTVRSRAEMDINFDIWFRRRFEENTYLGWFACDGDIVVAGIGLWLMDWAPGFDGFSGKLPYLLNVYTGADYRKQGLARLLVNTSLDWCREQGYPRVHLHASEFGRPLYEQLGFTQNNEMQLTLT